MKTIKTFEAFLFEWVKKGKQEPNKCKKCGKKEDKCKCIKTADILDKKIRRNKGIIR